MSLHESAHPVRDELEALHREQSDTPRPDMRIWKWPLDITDIQTLMLPSGARILTAQMQLGQAQLWALCDVNETEKSRRTIAIYGTGNPLPSDPGAYIATFQMPSGSLLWHVFEILAADPRPSST